MPQLYLNNFQTQFIAAVKGAPQTGSPAAELDYGILRVSDGAAGVLLNPAAGSWYILTAYKRSGSLEFDHEIMRVTAVDNSVVGECRLIVQRGQEGTSPKAYAASDPVELRLTAGAMGQYVQDADPRMSNPRAPTGPAGGVLAGAYPNPTFAQAMATAADLATKVDKVAGKALSVNDFTNADVAKLAGIAEQATKNATDAQLRDRASHTGVQAIATITGLQGALDGKEATIVAGTTAQYMRGDKTWRDLATDVRAAALTGLSLAANAAIVATDSVLAALGKLQAQITAHFGAGGAAHAAATTAAAGFMAAADKTKLDGVTAGATANATDAQLRDRATHTGAQAISTVTGLQGALDAKAPLTGVGASGTWPISINGSAGALISTDSRSVKPNAITAATARTFFASKTGMEGGSVVTDWVDVFAFNTYGDGTGGLTNALAFFKAGAGLWHYQGVYGSTTWNTPKQIAYTDSNITGNAASATKLATARTINGVAFDGTANITVADATKAPLTGNGASGTWPIAISGNASTASAVPWSGITGRPAVIAAGADAAAARAAIGAGTSNLALGTTAGTALAGNTPVQPPLVSGTNVKTVNGQSLLGSGDLTIAGAAPTDALAITYADGRVTSFTEDGVTKTLNFDGSGRLSTVVYPRGGKTRTETYTYNPDGTMAGMTASEA